MADDACALVKTDLQAGTFTRYTASFPIYINGKDKFMGQAKQVWFLLSNGRGNPVHTSAGTVLFTRHSCRLLIHAPSDELRDDLYDDVKDVLTASSSRSYVIKELIESPNLQFFNKYLELNFIP